MADAGSEIKSAQDFEQTPEGQAKRWAVEVSAAKRSVKKWHADGKKLVARFLDRRGNEDSDAESRINLFSANIQTQQAMLFGRTPKADVVRRFDDGQDAVGRCAATMLERLLQTDIEAKGDNYETALGLALGDFQIVGLGVVRLRYEADFEDPDDIEEVPEQKHPETGEVLAPAYKPEPQKLNEGVEVDYVHWRDNLWSPARTYHEVRWWGYRAYMTQDQVEKRFGEEIAALVPFAMKRSTDKSESAKHDPWSRAEVWEIWSKEDQKVYWWCEGCPKILDEKEDPLELEGFFPMPRPMVANLTTDDFMPRPDFKLAQDLYNEVDYISTRITWLERAVKVVGVYNQATPEIQRILTEGVDNQLLPAAWEPFQQAGGFKGQIDWLPLDQIVGALDKLREYRQELMTLTYQITGFSDIMRGEQQDKETATTSALKAKFASVRMKWRQNEFARFASEALGIKSEIICSLCEDDYILTGSNVQFTLDAPLAQQALQLLRSDLSKYRIEVKPENISMEDFDLLKSERMGFMQSFTQFLQAGAPLFQAEPEFVPEFLELLKYGLSGYRGASQVEMVLDKLIAKVQQKLAQPPPPPQQDPKQQGEMEKMKLEVGVAQEKAKTQIQTLQAKNQIDQQKLQIDAQRANMQMRQMVDKARVQAMTQAMEPAPGEAP